MLAQQPDGHGVDPATVAAVVAAAPGLVVVDEAYGQFSPWSALTLRGSGHPGLVVTRTFSKTWALAGARLGYLVADPTVVQACEAVVLPYHLSVQTQLAGLLALRHLPEMEAVGGPDRRGAGPGGRRAGRSAGGQLALGRELHLLPAPRRDADEVWRALLDRSILIRNCASWDGLKGCLRVTIGTPEENERFLHVP